MKLVKTTNQSKLRNLRIKELGRIANEGELINVTDERYEILSGKNKYKVPFVVLVEDGGPDLSTAAASKDGTNKKDFKTEEKIEIKTDETPEIFVIEPGQEPVQVDESLSPIQKEETPVPKKKRARKKKTEEVVETQAEDGK